MSGMEAAPERESSLVVHLGMLVDAAAEISSWRAWARSARESKLPW
jgi:hypothetical protein